MLYTDVVRGLLIPLALIGLALLALVRALAAGGGLQFAPLLLTACLLALAGMRLRHYFRVRALGRRGTGGSGGSGGNGGSVVARGSGGDGPAGGSGGADGDGAARHQLGVPVRAGNGRTSRRAP